MIARRTSVGAHFHLGRDIGIPIACDCAFRSQLRRTAGEFCKRHPRLKHYNIAFANVKEPCGAPATDHPSASDISPATTIADQGDTRLHPLEWRMTAVQFHAGWHSALKAIKRKCFDCSSASKSEVRTCALADCALHPFRQGKNPNRTYSREERAKRAEHLAKL